MSISDTDLYFYVTFPDGSEWTDCFKRVYHMNPEMFTPGQPSIIPTTLFRYRNDELKAADIKKQFKQFIADVNPGSNVKVKFKYEI